MRNSVLIPVLIVFGLVAVLRPGFPREPKRTCASQPSPTTQPASKPMQMQWHTVMASREGLVGHKTASGLVIKSTSMFAALPSRKALGRTIRVEYKDKVIEVPVLDVGPWNVNDEYWIGSNRPAAERGVRLPPMSKYGRPKNKAGLDLSDAAWDALGIPRKLGVEYVVWAFVD